MEWMAWTPLTATFFVAIALMLTGMAVWQKLSPSVARKGFLPITTHRGDRFFIGLLGSAYIHLIWLLLFEGASLWWAFGLAAVWLISVIRWG